ncbi:hypothetical protein AKJ65_02670 [candidate division MSBL1 archaeon SCGC-AAA259E19]|uniref:Probable [NiFe]-hydrogenase-type-3 Eha complex membrane subunit A n=1 Tax=candidate division MSBL1 archaeon SCGC-AAA259E19 TaxID=1698264 RepID=A0A133ULJ6_9EURY|nr:hypothetical protein AKJ65_02670 [candidate division MSBL1 archaeon SCGC-AAA259E19]
MIDIQSQWVVYSLGVIASLIVSRQGSGRWIPANKFSFHTSAIFPSPVLTVGTIAGLSEFLSFQEPIFRYLLPIIIGTVIGAVITMYSRIMMSPKGIKNEVG